jgi:hypothetical protein
MKTTNKSLNTAKKIKNDEFYTQITDIEKELNYYREHFINKIVFCNCDDPIESDFLKYFALNFKFLKLKKVITTHFETNKKSYKLEITKDNVDSIIKIIHENKNCKKLPLSDEIMSSLKENGDFRSPECIDLLNQADIVVTNPPFSLFREYVAQLIKYAKKFLIIGNMNAITYKEIFPLLKNNKIWLGHNNVKEFKQPDGSIKKFGNINWYTNLDYTKRHEKIKLYKLYEKEIYPMYDNYNAINVNKVKNIPMNYKGIMGVPITFLDKHNPDQFELLECCEPCIDLNILKQNPKFKEYKSRQILHNDKLCQKTYHRLLIKNKMV